ncbi:MAG: hypothetical protein AB7L66_08665 [Gemmatimonadales bacterium]
MPESISTATLPVGIVISPGSSRTTSARFWAFLWSIDREPDQDAPWHKRPPIDRDDGRTGFGT